MAKHFIDWLGIPPGRRWVDVGCGTGALSATALARTEPAAITGVDPSSDFVAHAAHAIVDPRARFLVGSAAALPLEAGSVDAVVSGLVLNFVPDLSAALREMARVGAPGAVIAGYVWDYAGEMQLVRRFWDAAIALDPAAAAQDEGLRFPICAPEPLARAFETAGLGDVEVRPIDVATVFRDFDDYWSPFLTGVGPAPGYATSLDEASLSALRDRLRATLPAAADGSIHLTARAWAVRGRTSSLPGGVDSLR